VGPRSESTPCPLLSAKSAERRGGVLSRAEEVRRKKKKKDAKKHTLSFALDEEGADAGDAKEKGKEEDEQGTLASARWPI
jgi:hypothetical protein